MRDIYHLWRESGAGGAPMGWWASVPRDEQILLLAELRVRAREARYGKR